MYGSIHELPPQVRNSLSPEDQKKFLKTYNGFDPKSEKETREALKKTWHACSKLPSAFTYEIVCGADIFDKDREMITVESIKKNLDDFISSGGPVQFEHGDYQISCVYDWAPCKTEGVDAVKVYGAIYGNDDVSREARKKFKKGLNSLSVAGEATFGKHYCEDGKCGMKRDVKVLKEISLCTVPANRLCKMISSHEGDDSGFTIKKSGSFVNLPVISVTVHDNSEPLCPLRQLERDLQTIGYSDAHATHAGVRVRMENSAFAKAYPYMEQYGLHAIRYGDDVYLAPKAYLIEKSFKDGLEEGYVAPDGTITSKITKSQFEALAERDVLEEKDGKFRIKKPGEING